MDSITNLIWHDGKLFSIDWTVWKIVGWLGNAIFFSRFIVQWYATEKRQQVIVPQAFWWLSLVGSLTLLCYSIHKRDSVFNQARSLGNYWALGLPLDAGDRLVERLRGVSAEQVKAVAAKYFGDDQLTVATLRPQPMGAPRQPRAPVAGARH